MYPTIQKIVLYLLLLLSSEEPNVSPEQALADLHETFSIPYAQPDTVYLTDTVYLPILEEPTDSLPKPTDSLDTVPPSLPEPTDSLPEALPSLDIALASLEEGSTQSGIVYIEALVSFPTPSVSFELVGQGLSKPWTERVKPYYFYGDASGSPHGFDTKTVPNGDYVLKVSAGSVTLETSFRIANQSSPPVYVPDTLSPLPPSQGADLGTILFSGAELQEWKKRAQSGPYKTKGDVSQNSPGDWDRIVQGKNSYVANPEADNWYGPTGSGLVQQWATPEPKNKSRNLIHAAFFAMVKQDAQVAGIVKANILKMIRTKRVDFADRSQWSSNMSTINPGFFVPDWALRIAHSYRYTYSYFAQHERAEVDKFLINVAGWCKLNMDAVMAKNWENRAQGIPAGSYKTPNPVDYTGKTRRTWDGGYPVPIFSQYTYNNRVWMYYRYMAYIGVEYNLPTYQVAAKQFFIEYLRYGCFTDGTMAELYRGPGGYSWSPGNTGYYYASINLACAIQTADYFARVGDFSLYDHVETGQRYGGYTAAMGGMGNYSLKTVIKTFLSYHTVDKTKKVDGQPLTGHWNNNQSGYVIDMYCALANYHYQDSFIDQAWSRTHPQAIQYPANVASMAGNSGYGGPLGSYPGVGFLFCKLPFNPYK